MPRVVKSSVFTKLEVVADVAAIVLSLSGAVVSLFLAKFLVAVVLGAVAIGIGLRFAARQKKKQAPKAIETPAWVRLSAALLATVECGVLGAAADFPVHFSQLGSSVHHWLVMGLVWLLAYVLQAAALRSLIAERHATNVR